MVFEQEDDKRRGINLFNWHLIILWLYACHLLRSLYTATLYAYMTKAPGPKDIPNTFIELIHNNSLPVLLNKDTYLNFYHLQTGGMEILR